MLTRYTCNSPTDHTAGQFNKIAAAADRGAADLATGRDEFNTAGADSGRTGDTTRGNSLNAAAADDTAAGNAIYKLITAAAHGGGSGNAT